MQSHTELKERHRATRQSMSAGLNTRIHRALSWLHRAEQCEDSDGQFVFLWIAFNAAYAQDIPQHLRLSEQDSFREFLLKLHLLDKGKLLDDLTWREFSGPIRVLLDNPYVFESFWEFHRGNLTEIQWKERLAKGKKTAAILLAKGNTPELLRLVFHRIYTLRNQLMHGGATWNSQVNRAQLRDGCAILGALVPTILDILLEATGFDDDPIAYPVIPASSATGTRT